MIAALFLGQILAFLHVCSRPDVPLGEHGGIAPTHYSPLNGLSPVVPLLCLLWLCLMPSEFNEVAIGIVNKNVARAVVGAHARA